MNPCASLGQVGIHAAGTVFAPVPCGPAHVQRRAALHRSALGGLAREPHAPDAGKLQCLANHRRAHAQAAAAVELSNLRLPGCGNGEPDVNVAYCPERLLIENDRIIGGITPPCSERTVALYRVFVRGQLVVTIARTTEMCRPTENSFRDVNIALANEISLIRDKLGIDVWGLIRLANRHPRVNILQPGTACLRLPSFDDALAQADALVLLADHTPCTSRPIASPAPAGRW